MAKTSATYDVAISFAGEDRALASEIASGLVTKGVNVFYDEYSEADLWGKDLYSHLTSIYRDESIFCLMLVSSAYVNKQWTNHERRAAQSRAFTENREYILPLRLDDADVEGVLDTTGYVDVRRKTVEEVVALVVEKVRAFEKENGISHEIVTVTDVFVKGEIRPPNGLVIEEERFETSCPTCGTAQNLSQATLSLDHDDTLYTCRNGCQTIVVVSRRGLVGWPGRGYRIGDYVIRNASDLRFAHVLVPASRAALMKSRPQGL